MQLLCSVVSSRSLCEGSGDVAAVGNVVVMVVKMFGCVVGMVGKRRTDNSCLSSLV